MSEENRRLTTNAGAPIHDNQNSLTVGERGPTLLQDYQLIEKLAHFDRERIPERVVHARGAGAHGYFEAYGGVSHYTKAKFLQEKGRQTPVFVRFSTVIHQSGSPETLRDPRGFAVKFYTEDGNYDLVGNNLPVFFIRDAMKFPDVVHAFKPDPRNNMQDPNRYWDFLSNTPESLHMVTWLFSDLGVPANYRQMSGFGVHTFKWVNTAGQEFFVKYHWIPKQGVACLTDPGEIVRVGGQDHQHATRDLWEAIGRGDYPEWELQVQVLDPSREMELNFDPLDATKVFPEHQFPLIPVGRLVLNRNPENYFAEVEQAAFAPALVVPGIELSNDKLLQGRAFSYPDTQRYRLGANYLQIPVNTPKVEVHNNQRDGFMTMKSNPHPINYEPSGHEASLKEHAGGSPAGDSPPAGSYLEGPAIRVRIARTNDFQQAGDRYRSLAPDHQDRLVRNIAGDMKGVDLHIKSRMVHLFTRADEEFGARVARELGVEAEPVHPE